MMRRPPPPGAAAAPREDPDRAIRVDLSDRCASGARRRALARVG